MTRYLPEKRRAPREKHDTVLEIFDARGERVACVAILADISTTGASCRSTHPFVKGEPVRARLRILGRGVLDISGHITRIKEFNNYTLYGIAFVSAGAPKGK